MTMQTTETRSDRSSDLALGAADFLCLAATPTFAVMAVLTGRSPDVLCMGGSPLGGMACMYLLMSACHAAPWLRRFARRR